MIKFRAEKESGDRSLFGIGMTVDDVNGIYSGGPATIFAEEVGLKGFDVMILIAENHEVLKRAIKKAFGDIDFKEQGKLS